MTNTTFLTLVLLVIIISTTHGGNAEDEEDKPSEKWKKKDVRDYNDADVERLFEQWEEDEEKDPDDLMEHERPAPKIDFSKMDPKNPEGILQMSKKGKTLMMFVTVSGDPTQEEAETITQRWQDQLFNANYQLQRYMVDSNRAIFLLKDGALAWEMKNFLIEQDRCYEVTIDNKSYYGKGSGRMDENTPAGAKKDSKSKTKKGKGKKKKKAKVEDNKTEL
ncbi:LDLR chaperone boca-like [Lytechinus variegatus]|uniref:LDLR chaperone boca-like n=1 Tax=Lytechinus variegatus TaxID=7654 RepID=UPI001BB13D61|nr:LDLR chaperone boca-like [Lytechinus variegatus]